MTRPFACSKPALGSMSGTRPRGSWCMIGQVMPPPPQAMLCGSQAYDGRLTPGLDVGTDQQHVKGSPMEPLVSYQRTAPDEPCMFGCFAQFSGVSASGFG